MTKPKSEQSDKKIRVVTKEDGMVYLEFPRLSKWNSRHSPNCSVCNHPRVGEIERNYMDWCTDMSICARYEIKDVGMLKRHAVSTGLNKARIGDRRKIYETIIERWLNSGGEPSNKDAMDALQHLDKLDGKVVERSEHTVKRAEDRDAQYKEIARLIGVRAKLEPVEVIEIEGEVSENGSDE